MAVIGKPIIPGSQLTTSAATYYTSTGVKTRIDAIALTNTTASAATATVHRIASGGSASASNCVMSAKSINAGETVIVMGLLGQWLDPGDFIQALSSANTTITIVASGVQQS